MHDLSPLVVALGLTPVNPRQLPHAVPSYNLRRRVTRDFGGDSTQGPTALNKDGKSSILDLERPPSLPLSLEQQPSLAAAAAAVRSTLGGVGMGSVLSVATPTTTTTATGGGMSKAAVAAEAAQKAHEVALEATKATARQLAQRGVTTHVPMLQDPSRRPYLVCI